MLTASMSTASRATLIAAWLSPLQLAAFCAAATGFLLCVLSGEKVLGDPDTNWHIAGGRWMIENASWPTTDFYSHTFDGHRWIAKEWLSQLLLAFAWDVGSWRGVVVLCGLAVALTLAMVTWFAGSRAGIAGGLLMAGLSLVTFAPVMIARPLLLVFPVIVGWTIALVRSAERGRRPPWIALPLLLLWVNMHGAFTMGIVIAAAFGLEALLRADRASLPRVLVEWGAFGLSCLAVTCVTPYGWEPLWVNALMANSHEVLPFLAEWQGADLSARWIFLAAIVLACIAVLASDLRPNAARFLLVAFLAYAMFRHQRLAMIFALVVPIAVGPALIAAGADVLRRIGLFQSGLPLSAAAAQMLAALLIVAGGVATLLVSPAPPPTAAAPAALASVPDQVRRERVFNSHDLGGFLILNGVKTFFDGRNDQLFLGGFFTRTMNATTAESPAPLAALLDERGVRWALILKEKPEARLFPRLDGWRLHFADASSEVWIRNR